MFDCFELEKKRGRGQTHHVCKLTNVHQQRPCGLMRTETCTLLCLQTKEQTEIFRTQEPVWAYKNVSLFSYASSLLFTISERSSSKHHMQH